MRTEPDSQEAAVFLFAHQDDEFGVFQSIELERARGHRVHIAYLTTGVRADASSAVRDSESLRALSGLGVPRSDVLFAGSVLQIPDGALAGHLQRAVQWLATWFDTIPALARVYVPAWEGGHPDHDCLHAAALMASVQQGFKGSVRQYPLYNAYRLPAPMFRVMSPLPPNGAVERVPIPLVNRFRFMRNCLGYPSQFKSWLGLFPFAALHYLLVGAEFLQEVSTARLRERPHAGALYYEHRRFATWDEVNGAILACLPPDQATTAGRSSA